MACRREGIVLLLLLACGGGLSESRGGVRAPCARQHRHSRRQTDRQTQAQGNGGGRWRWCSQRQYDSDSATATATATPNTNSEQQRRSRRRTRTRTTRTLTATTTAMHTAWRVLGQRQRRHLSPSPFSASALCCLFKLFPFLFSAVFFSFGEQRSRHLPRKKPKLQLQHYNITKMSSAEAPANPPQGKPLQVQIASDLHLEFGGRDGACGREGVGGHAY